jgi:Skp family chaperone for outer membrane proteins
VKKKRTVLLMAGMAALATATYFASHLWAQAGGAVAPTGGVRVGLVNVGTIFLKYEKAKDFKEQLMKKVSPFKENMEKWRKEMIEYQDLLQKGDTKYNRQDLEKAITDRKRALEDADKAVRNLVGKQSEDQLVQLWREIIDRVEIYGKQNGFHVVLGYGDPPDPKDLHTFANINRKMQGMDIGAITPLFVAPGLEISEQVVQSLNASYMQNRVVPTSGSAPVAPK